MPPPPSVIATVDLLPMVRGEDYAGVLVCMSHYEDITGYQVRRIQVLQADERISVTSMHHLERLPYAPQLAVIRDEIDGRELYYRQDGWYYGPDGHAVGAFARVDVTGLTAPELGVL